MLLHQRSILEVCSVRSRVHERVLDLDELALRLARLLLQRHGDVVLQLQPDLLPHLADELVLDFGLDMRPARATTVSVLPHVWRRRAT